MRPVTLKLRVLNQFGASQVLNHPDEIEVVFAYNDTDQLKKRLTHGDVRVLNDAKGEFEVDLDDFEVQGLNVSDFQSIGVSIKNDSVIKTASFPKAYHVRTIEVEGQARKEIVLP